MSAATTRSAIAPDATVGPVALRVADLDRSLTFYTGVLGLRVLDRADAVASLGAEHGPLLTLAERPDARPRPARSTGLYHVALLVPSRAHLGMALRALAGHGYPLDGAADHAVSEALYLSDPDGIGLEIYADRPRTTWPHRDGELALVTDSLDLPALLREPPPAGPPLGAGVRVGHVHLQVGDLAAAEGFYCDVLGFDVMSRWGASALFLAAGGYHHHLGLNTWAGVGAPAAPADAAGLMHFTIRLPDANALAAVRTRAAAAGIPLEEHDGALWLRDPSHNGVRLAVDA